MIKRLNLNFIKQTIRFKTDTSKNFSIPHRAPQKFKQTVVLTNGSTITLRTTSPKGLLLLTKDTHNNQLWNPHLITESDLDNDNLAKFTKKFSGLEDFGLDEEDNVFDTMTSSSGALKVTSKDMSFLSSKKNTGKK